MPAERRTVEVVADWVGLPQPVLMGVLHATPSRGNEIFAFEYDRAWLELPDARALDPQLALVRGPQYPPAGRDGFGLFLDSSPDRWGRVLMQRREALEARRQKRSVRTLIESDYLLGVYDGHRMGALRYRFAAGPFLDDNAELASPPWTSLRELEQASLRLERGRIKDDDEQAKWLRMLIAPGRSLGGARPKASVVDTKGRLWIAKFPSSSDVQDVGAWESLMHAMAKQCGIAVPETTALKLGSKHRTFLSRRFDRDDASRRIHFASAMTVLQRHDGEPASYLDIAELVVQNGAEPGRDLEQLWRRIVFNVLTSNVDDHLRNHGFLLAPRGWTLSPAYDMNPVPTGNGLMLNISDVDNAQDLELVREVAPRFRIPPDRVRTIVDEIVAVVATWPTFAKTAKIPKAEHAFVEPAFRLATRARK